MKITYNILWLDDQIDNFIEDEFVQAVENHLKDEGFIPNIVTVSRSGDFFNKLKDSSNFDLILTDFNLSVSEKNGNDVVKEIRSENIYTEILFYTAQKMANLGNTNGFERVSFLATGDKNNGHYQLVIDKAIEIINLTIKKFQHIVVMRGMIMHETSSLDAQSQNILESYISCETGGCCKCVNKKKCSIIATEIIEGLSKCIEEKQKKVKKGNFKRIIADNLLFSATYKALALKKILEQIHLSDFSKEYVNEIINVRNQFAHVVLEKDSTTGLEYFSNKKDSITFDEEYCKKIRKNINKHKQNLDNLEKSIESN